MADESGERPTVEGAEMRTCEQCGEEYVKGEGATEPGLSRVRLTERFCCESCAEEYERQTNDADDE